MSKARIVEFVNVDFEGEYFDSISEYNSEYSETQEWSFPEHHFLTSANDLEQSTVTEKYRKGMVRVYTINGVFVEQYGPMPIMLLDEIEGRLYDRKYDFVSLPEPPFGGLFEE